MTPRGPYRSRLERTPDGDLYRGSKIRTLREGHGLTLARFSEQVGVNHTVASKIEVNRILPSDRFLIRSSEVLEVDIIDILNAPLHPRLMGQGRVVEDILMARLRELDQRTRFGRQLEKALDKAALNDELRKLAEGELLRGAEVICQRLTKFLSQ